MSVLIPLTRQLVLDADTPVSAFSKLHRGPFGFLLESLEGGERWARYSFMATEPREVHRYRGRSRQRWTEGAGWVSEGDGEAPLTHLGEMMRRYPAVEVPGLPRFIGGAVGYIGYDVVRTLEELPAAPADDRNLPDAIMMVADTLLVLDNLYHRATVIHNVELPQHGTGAIRRERIARGEERIDRWVDRLRAPSALSPLPTGRNPAADGVTSNYPRERFAADVRRIKEHIAAGDTFQTVLSRRTETAVSDPWRTYRYLRALNPAPYLFFLHLDDIHLLGSSPEVLVRVEGDDITVRPIAGTRPRGTTPEHDRQMENDLRHDPKERAEHLMLVDLGRNDIGRVAEFGSVRVTELMKVERYSHVMHLVSEVHGRLRADHDAVSALAACFPAGTVSGAPKLRAMEIIDTLEPSKRGPYAGAVGYIGWGGRTLDTAITIRGCVIKDGKAWIQAGAGIVADSDPDAEYEETEAKARAVLRAIALSNEPASSEVVPEPIHG